MAKEFGGEMAEITKVFGWTGVDFGHGCQGNVTGAALTDGVWDGQMKCIPYHILLRTLLVTFLSCCHS